VLLGLLGLLALAACGIRRAADPGTARLFENRPWQDTGAGAAPGSYRVFLADGTLIMGSCVETYRLAAWRWTGEGIAWDEDGAEVRAEIGMVGPDELVLVLGLAGGAEARSYRAAPVPFTCPGSD
jgi:hypothetical protein